MKDNRLPRIFDELLSSSNVPARARPRWRAFNAAHPQVKRGLALTPVKFGISFTTAFLNQAGALVVVYADGSIQLNHGGTEMGQGLHTKMLAICAHELGVPPAQRAGDDRPAPTRCRTPRPPRPRAGPDLNGAGGEGRPARRCASGCGRWRRGCSGVPSESAKDILFAGGRVFLARGPSWRCPSRR